MNQLFRRKNYSKNADSSGLHRVLGVWDIVFFGLAAIIGAGSFSSLGEAIFRGGPGVINLYIICGVACAFTAMSYAEFASRIPTAGSAYTYAYASFGELIAWVIGWALIMEYSFGNIYVAFSWSDYFTSFLERINIHFPDYLCTSYPEAKLAFDKSIAQASSDLSFTNKEHVNAWTSAPMIGNLKMILDIPALLINAFITWLVYIGIKESKNVNNLLVILKLAVIFLIIGVGIFYINSDNWTPVNNEGVQSMMPNGFSGVMAAVSGVFFAYIGFDALSVLSEETKDPQKNLPKGMIISLVVSTVVYIVLTLILTGIVDYRKFEGIGDPLAFIFAPENGNLPWMEFAVSIAAIIAITSVLLVFQMGQPRIWYAMSRDGLLPKKFSSIHPKYKTPGFATIITGIAVGLPILFTDKSFILDFTSIGTIFAFVLVNAGILLMPAKEKIAGRFHMPYVNSKIIFPVLFLGSLVGFYFWVPEFFQNLFDWSDANEGEFRMSVFFYILINLVLVVLSFAKNLSLIPLLGLSSCLYLLTGMTHNNWFWFGLWFALGLIIYFMYGYRKSHLRSEVEQI
ncbi:APC family permease [Frigoriflavimonas asaccharolytica]|uniref:Amino acid transporter n=1 Tax=Frigoriflavimonas asaccharolytica TaxID=2735899 RepID=A0A8J8G5S2_9FLAO|nr:amino acid permease [Frigoriflavimonas asaccharolytica]NRS91993.1 amino acid transporter [Frigoriflavimonas asaccharolytica]